MQKRKRHPYPHIRRFAIALILTIGVMLYLIFYNPYPIIAIPPYFELLPFIYVPLTLWWLPLGFRYLRRFQVQKCVVDNGVCDYKSRDNCKLSIFTYRTSHTLS